MDHGWGLTLVGSSPYCKVRLLEPGTSRYACGLVRTPNGVWVVDLLSSRGVAINGAACRLARLEDGDVLEVGGQAIRLNYDGPAIPDRHHAATGQVGPGDGAPLPAPIDLGTWADQSPTQEAWELLPGMILQQLQGRDGPASGASLAPFDHALLMLVRLLGEVHRDHLKVVREEMEQIRRLNREMGSLKAQLTRPDPPALDVASPVEALPGRGDSRSDSERPPGDRPTSPQAVKAMVGERLAAWEKERRSRWRKVVDLLVKP